MSAGARLASKLELAAPVYLAAVIRLWSGPRVREIYPVYLATMHMVARASVPLLIAARERARALAADPESRAAGAPAVAEALIGICNFEIARRVGLAEALLDDLAATGAAPDLPLAAIPSPKVASLVGAPYYWIHHHHPVAVLGHLAALEHQRPAPGFADALARRTGFPAAAFACLRASERRHPAVLAELDRLPLGRGLEILLGLAALHAVDAGVEVLGEVFERVVERDPDGSRAR